MFLDFLLVFLLGVAVSSLYWLATAAKGAQRAAEAAESRERAMQERLLGAWKDGYAVPPEPQPPTAAELEDSITLIPELQALVDDWDSPAARAAQVQVIRDQLAHGRTQMEVFNDLMPVEPEIALEGATA